MKAHVERVSTSSETSFLCRRRTDRQFGFHWHFHPEIELTAIVRSCGRRFVGDSIQPYDDGDLVLVGANLPHTWNSDPGRRGRHEAVFCQFARGFVPLPELKGVERLFDRAARGLRFTGRTQRSVYRRMEQLDRLQGLRRLSALLEILEELARSTEATPLSGRRYGAGRRSGDGERIDRVCRHLDARYLEGVSLEEAAGVAHLSIPAFSRLFKRTTGKTLVEYLNELRTGHACRELMETERSVSDIAYDSGFNNLSNFNRRFRALKGLSPREYREAFRLENH